MSTEKKFAHELIIDELENSGERLLSANHHVEVTACTRSINSALHILTNMKISKEHVEDIVKRLKSLKDKNYFDESQIKKINEFLVEFL